MSKPSKHSAAILAFITSFGDNCTTSDITESLGLSSSRTRELLAAELKAGTVDRHHADVDGDKVLVWTVKAAGSAPNAPEAAPVTAENLTAPKPKAGKKGADKPAPKAKATKAAKTPKDKKPRRKASGIGKPNAKKVVNPQQTLDLKKAMVERHKGKMTWENRVWKISVNGETVTYKSRELASMTLEALAKALGLKIEV